MFIKKESKVYIGTSTAKLIELPIYQDVNFSQLLKQEEYETTTLHNPEYLYSEGAVRIANPGNFQFTIPIMSGTEFGALFSIIKDYKTPLLIYTKSSNSNYFKLLNCVITNAVFNTVQDELITLSVTGEFGKWETAVSLPVAPTILSREYMVVHGLGVTRAGVNIPYITSFNMEFSAGVTWDDYFTMHSPAVQYPETYYISDRTFSGTIECTETSFSSLHSHTLGSELIAQINYDSEEKIKIIMPSVICTERLNFSSEIVRRAFDFRLDTNTEVTVRIDGVNV